MTFPGLSKKKTLSASPDQPRIFIDASSFTPKKVQKNGRAVLIVTQNAEEIIYELVCQELMGSVGVVVLDLNSTDSTPYLAAEAGAVVVLQENGTDKDDAFCQALTVARRLSDNVVLMEIQNKILDKVGVVIKPKGLTG